MDTGLIGVTGLMMLTGIIRLTGLIGLMGLQVYSHRITLRSRYFKSFKCEEFPLYMWELEISKLDISGKKFYIHWHLVSTLGGCAGLERTHL